MKKGLQVMRSSLESDSVQAVGPRMEAQRSQRKQSQAEAPSASSASSASSALSSVDRTWIWADRDAGRWNLTLDRVSAYGMLHGHSRPALGLPAAGRRISPRRAEGERGINRNLLSSHGL